MSMCSHIPPHDDPDRSNSPARPFCTCLAFPALPSATSSLTNHHSGALLAEDTSLLWLGAIVPALLALQETEHATGPFALAISRCIGVCREGGILSRES